MEIDVVKKSDKFQLYIQGEMVLEDRMLSNIVIKIEEILKTRYLPPQEKGVFGRMFGK